MPTKQPKRPPRNKQAKVAKTSPLTTEDEPKREPPAAKSTSSLPKGIAQGTWNGYPLYQCERCPFNDLQLARVVEHVASTHAPKYVDTGLVGPTGGSIIKEVTDGKD